MPNLMGTKFFSIVILLVSVFLGLSSVSQAQQLGNAFRGMGDNDKPIQIEADKLEIIDNENTALLTGNVNVVQGDTLLKARQLTVYYLRDNERGKTNSGIRKIVASGKVAVRSADNNATANSATVDMLTEFVTLSGNVTISQGANVVKGCKVTVNLKTNVSKVQRCGDSSQGSGRIQLLLDPKSRKTN